MNSFSLYLRGVLTVKTSVGEFLVERLRASSGLVVTLKILRSSMSALYRIAPSVLHVIYLLISGNHWCSNKGTIVHCHVLYLLFSVDISFGRRLLVPCGTLVHLLPSGKTIPPSSNLAKRSPGPPLGEKSIEARVLDLTVP